LQSGGRRRRLPRRQRRCRKIRRHSFRAKKAIIAADANGNALRDLLDPYSPRVRIALSNKGSATAFRCLHESWMELASSSGDVFMKNDFTFTPNAEHFESTNSFSLYPNHDPIVINIPIRAGLTEVQRQAIRSAKLLGCVRIRLTFKDIFSPSRYADFGFWVMWDGMGFLSKYNDSN
jgi:hypothetical protein